MSNLTLTLTSLTNEMNMTLYYSQILDQWDIDSHNEEIERILCDLKDENDLYRNFISGCYNSMNFGLKKTVRLENSFLLTKVLELHKSLIFLTKNPFRQKCRYFDINAFLAGNYIFATSFICQSIFHRIFGF